jgi:hypothetical protein
VAGRRGHDRPRLVNKGQSVDKTTDAFRSLRDGRHLPDADDDAPRHPAAVLAGTDYGLLNQIRILRKAARLSLQVLMMTPSAGTKLLRGTPSPSGR